MSINSTPPHRLRLHLSLSRSFVLYCVFFSGFLVVSRGFLRECMAVSLVCGEVSDLCIGKPALRPLPSTATVGDALLALRSRCGGELCVSFWSADKKTIAGRVSVVDVVCYLCSESNIADPARALADPVSVLLPKDSGLVCRLEPNSWFAFALCLFFKKFFGILGVPGFRLVDRF